MNKDQLIKANALQKEIEQKQNELKHGQDALTQYQEGAKADRGELRYYYKNGCGTFSFALDATNVEKALKAEVELVKSQIKALELQFNRL